MTHIKKYINQHKDRFINELIELLKIPSISADPKYKEDVLKCANAVAKLMNEAGAENIKICETSGYPIVYGEKIIDQQLPTVLIYGHYDVQPPDPLDLWDSGRLCPHFHIPLQSGSDRILGLMRRRYDSKLFLESIEKVRSRVDKASITTDVIVGFPGETEEDFIATKSVCDRAKFSDMHVFKFSKRNGTIAAHLEDDVSYQVKSRRSRELITMGEKYFSDFRMEMDGSSENVLWETKSVSAGRPKFIYGLTENYVRVKGKYESLESDLEELVVKYDSSNPVGPMIACH